MTVFDAMPNVRIIARMDIKKRDLIKGVQMEGWRKFGDPIERAKEYYTQSVDEIIAMDVVASLYERNNLADIVEEIAKNVFVPLTVGGGIRSVDDARALLSGGADKVAINTAAIKNPDIISEISNEFGSQAVVLSIEAKSIGEGKWEALTDNGRNRTGFDVLEWIARGEELGAGEIMITSIDRDGTEKGYDIELAKLCAKKTKLPIIVSGGFGNVEHASELIEQTLCSGLCVAKAVHKSNLEIGDIRDHLISHGIPTRRVS